MFCPNCGSFVQDGSPSCVNCGNKMPVEDTNVEGINTNSTYSANNYGSYSGVTNDNNTLHSGMGTQKSNKGLIIATLIGIVALILTAFLCSALIKNSSGKLDGTYECEEFYEDQNCTLEIVISKGKFEYNMKEPYELPVYKGSVDIVGNIVTFKPKASGSYSDESFSGTYNKAKKTITFKGNTSADTMIFKKS